MDGRLDAMKWSVKDPVTLIIRDQRSKAMAAIPALIIPYAIISCIGGQ